MQGTWLCAVDPSNGALLAKQGVQCPAEGSSFLASPSRTHILIKPTGKSGIVYEMPSLRETCRPACPATLLKQDPTAHLDWLGWSSADQLVAIWHSKACVRVAVYNSHDGRLEAQHDTAGCWACIKQHDAAAAPQQPFLAFAVQEVPGHGMQGDDHQAGYECPGQSAYVLHLTNGQTSVFVLSGEVGHPVKVFWSWSPTGQALAMTENVRGYGTVLVWHLPTRTALLETDCIPDEVVWSSDGTLCAIRSSYGCEHVLQLDGAHAVPDLEDRSHMFTPAGPAWSAKSTLTISPCSTRLVHAGANLPRPTHIEQWRLAPREGFFSRQPVTGSAAVLGRGPPAVAWYPSLGAACAYVVAYDGSDECNVHLMRGADATQIAAWTVHGRARCANGKGYEFCEQCLYCLPGSTPHLAVPFKSVMWSPDGMRLAAQRGWLLTVLNFSQQGPTARSNPERAELLAAVGRRPREGLSTRFENLQN